MSSSPLLSVMAEFLPDDIICNIISRLPAKPLLRFRCVSRYWSRTLSEPNFMKLRSRKTIILPSRDAFLLIDDLSNSIVKRRYTFEPLLNRKRLSVIGTFNGVVLLSISTSGELILYNPFTGVSRELTFPPTGYISYAYGFATPDDGDLKIFRFKQDYNDFCDVYNFRENSWSSWNISKYKIVIKFHYNTGHYVNGFLYWIAYHRNGLISVNIKDMELSEMYVPFQIFKGFHVVNHLGTMNGCLCTLESVTGSGFNMWVMKEHNQWSKIYSFELYVNKFPPYHAMCFLESRRILLSTEAWDNFIIYDMLRDSHKILNITINRYLSQSRESGFEYVESVISPLDIMNACVPLRKIEVEK